MSGSIKDSFLQGRVGYGFSLDLSCLRVLYKMPGFAIAQKSILLFLICTQHNMLVANGISQGCGICLFLCP